MPKQSARRSHIRLAVPIQYAVSMFSDSSGGPWRGRLPPGKLDERRAHGVVLRKSPPAGGAELRASLRHYYKNLRIGASYGELAAWAHGLVMDNKSCTVRRWKGRASSIVHSALLGSAALPA